MNDDNSVRRASHAERRGAASPDQYLDVAAYLAAVIGLAVLLCALVALGAMRLSG